MLLVFLGEPCNSLIVGFLWEESRVHVLSRTRTEIEAPTVRQMEGLFLASQGKIQDKVVALAEPENKRKYEEIINH